MKGDPIWPQGNLGDCTRAILISILSTPIGIAATRTNILVSCSSVALHLGQPMTAVNEGSWERKSLPGELYGEETDKSKTRWGRGTKQTNNDNNNNNNTASKIEIINEFQSQRDHQKNRSSVVHETIKTWPDRVD